MDKLYLETNLPEYLMRSLLNFKKGKEKSLHDKNYCRFDCDFCEFQSDINCAEVDGEISQEQADYLRTKYLYS